MCLDCGCQEAGGRTEGVDEGGIHIHVHVHLADGHGHVHVSHDHVHDHGHDHDHDHDHGREMPEAGPRTRTVEIGASVLARNDRAAGGVRSWLEERGVVAVNLISSPGTGKTLLLEKTLDALRGRLACAVITGDQQTDNDARRLAGRGAPVAQIETRSACHLNAEQVRSRLESVVTGGVRLLFIENVGNLVCPAAFDLGERMKIALLSVTEGEDKPLKYPGLFHDAPVTVITKLDLVPHLDFDLERCREAVRAVRPEARIMEVSALTGQGMDDWLDFLEELATSGAG
jgi:hydrogenase nickel incorporation protein HypB